MYPHLELRAWEWNCWPFLKSLVLKGIDVDDCELNAFHLVSASQFPGVDLPIAL
jgi:hypothetical protein